MTVWCELTSGVFVNLEMIEAIVPTADPSVWRFHPPRTQRGGRPTGRPIQQAVSYNEDRGFWEGSPTRPQALLAYLRAHGMPEALSEAAWGLPEGETGEESGGLPEPL